MTLLTQVWFLEGSLVLVSALFIFYFYLTRNFKYWKKLGVREIPPTPLFGNFGPPILAQKPVANLLQEIYKESEDDPYIGFYILDKPHLLLRDPEIIKTVLIKDFPNFSDRIVSSEKSDVIGNTNLFVVNNPKWKHIRNRLSPIFTSGRLKKMFDLMLEIRKDFDVYLDSLELDGKGRDVEVKDICALFTTDMIGITAYGLKFNALTDPESMLRKAGKDIFAKSYKRYMELFSSLLIPKFVKIFGLHVLGKGNTMFVRDVFQQAMEQRISSGVKKPDLIDLLLDLKKQQENEPDGDGIKLSDDELIAQAAVFFTGGFETSSTTMSFSLYELAKRKEVQNKLRQEILEVLAKNNGNITYEMVLSSFTYLDMVISETLRMHPVLPYLDRIANKDYEFTSTKLKLKSGVPVVIPMQAIQMDENNFPNPHMFDPERFSAVNKAKIKPNTYFPFGDGPRFCIGMRLGQLQTKLGLINMLSKYEFSPCEKTSDTMEYDKYSVILSSQNEIVLNMRKIAAC